MTVETFRPKCCGECKNVCFSGSDCGDCVKTGNDVWDIWNTVADDCPLPVREPDPPLEKAKRTIVEEGW